MAKRIKSGIKRTEIAERNHLRNIAVKSAVKTRFKRVREAQAEGGAIDEALLKVAISSIDRATRKGIIHPNAAARRKSRLIKQLRTAPATK